LSHVPVNIFNNNKVWRLYNIFFILQIISRPINSTSALRYSMCTKLFRYASASIATSPNGSRLLRAARSRPARMAKSAPCARSEPKSSSRRRSIPMPTPSRSAKDGRTISTMEISKPARLMDSTKQPLASATRRPADRS
jgi:hypothetical protein